MPWGNMRGFELLILLVLILLLFGAKRLPDLTRSVARSLKIFKSEVKNPTTDSGAEAAADPKGPASETTTGAAQQAHPAGAATPDAPPAATSPASSAGPQDRDRS